MPDVAEWPALMRGEALIRDVTNPSNVPGVLVFFVVSASRDAVWRTLVDYRNFTKVFPDIDQIKVLSEDQQGARVRAWMSVLWMKFDYTLDRIYERPGYRLSWQRSGGSFKHISGSWEILDIEDPERLLVIYESYVEIGFVVPTALVRSGARDRAKAMTQRFRHWVEAKQSGSN